MSKKDPSEGKIVKILPSSEREIAEIQLARLQEISRNRNLTLEEIKMYDLLVKNLMLIKGKPTSINGKNKVDNLSDAELLNIADIIPKKLVTNLDDD